MKLSRIAEIIGARIEGETDSTIDWLLTDSRSLSFPSETVFFAIHTQRNDGHNYIAELYRENLRCFVVNDSYQIPEEFDDAHFLKVENTLDALQVLAAAHRAQFHIPIVGITGSNGKTIVKEWLYQVLRHDFRVVRSPRSYNSQIGVPLSVWALNENSSLGIFEAGISLANEMQRLEKIIKPSIGIITNLGDAHQENFSDLEQKAREKLKLFADAELLIFNSDNQFLKRLIAESDFKGTLFSWGKTEEDTVRLLKVEKLKSKTQISVRYKTEIFDFFIPFTDDASLENAMQALSLLLYFGIDIEQIKERMLQLEPVAMRMELKEGVSNCLIINDSYNSDINSLGIALDFMAQQATDQGLSRTLILSDIMQSGFDEEDLYRRIADLVKRKGIQRFIGVGRDIKRQKNLFVDMEARFFQTTDELLRTLSIQDFQNELILLKGSRRFQFEQITAMLELAVHETILEVNLNALVDNFNWFRSKLHPKTKIMSMVKAFAYGSGSYEVARSLQHHQCNYLAVALADEGVELRRKGIRIPIVVMNPEKAGFELIFENKLEPEIYSFRLLNDFIAAAEKLGISDYPIHVKIDSGMHRLGFKPSETEDLIERLKSQAEVKIRSVFTHLAATDEACHDDFSKTQVEIFLAAANKIKANFSHRILLHALNSAGIEHFPQYQFDMVRLGIGHYGLSTWNNKLDTVCRLKTVILQTREVPAGETVGYSRKALMEKNTRIAVLPIGYADGFDRRLSNGVGEVWIRGKRAKVIGNVCMDLTMVDLTGIEEAQEGDAVEIFGDNIRIQDLAEKLNTISYEVLTGISRRVKRIYFQE